MVRGVSRPARCAGAAAAVLLFALAWRILPFTGFTNDDYMHQARAQQMLLGNWPVRDFLDPGMPLMYLLSAAAQWFAGDDVAVELFVDSTLIALGAALTVFGVAVLTDSVFVALLAALLEILIFPRSYSYPKMVLYAAAAVLMITVVRSPTRHRIVLLGLLVSVAFLFRHDHGVCIGAGAAAMILLLSWRSGWDVAGRRIGALAAGALPLAGLWLAYVQWQQGVVTYFRLGVDYSLAEARSGTFLRPAFHWFHSGLSELYSAQNSEAWLCYVFTAIPLVAIAGAWLIRYRGRERWPGEAVVVASIGIVGLLANAGMLRDALNTRLRDVVVLAVVLGGWMLARAWRASPRTSIARIGSRIGIALVLTATVAAILKIGDASEQLDRAGLYGTRNGFRERLAELRGDLFSDHAAGRMPSSISGALRGYLPYLERCTSTADRLFITTFAPDVFVLAKRGFAGGHMEFLPDMFASEADQNLVVGRLRRESVPLVLTPLQSHDDFRRSFPIIQSYLDERYVALGGDVGDLRVFVDKSRRAFSIDEESKWPCFRS